MIYNSSNPTIKVDAQPTDVGTDGVMRICEPRPICRLPTATF